MKAERLPHSDPVRSSILGAEGSGRSSRLVSTCPLSPYDTPAICMKFRSENFPSFQLLLKTPLTFQSQEDKSYSSRLWVRISYFSVVVVKYCDWGNF